MQATSTDTVRNRHVVWGRLVPAGALALVLAAVANVVVYLVASSLGRRCDSAG